MASNKTDLSAMSDAEIVGELRRVYSNCLGRLNGYSFAADPEGAELDADDPGRLVAIDMGILLCSKLQTLTDAFLVWGNGLIPDEDEPNEPGWNWGLVKFGEELKNFAFSGREKVDA